MSVYRLLALRYLLQRWDRAALIGASAEFSVSNGEAGVLRSITDELRAANIPGLKSVQPLVYDRITLPDLDGRVAVLIGAEVSTQLLDRDNDLKVSVEPLW